MRTGESASTDRNPSICFPPLALLLFLLTQQTFSQATLHGIIADSSTYTPLPYANVQIIGTRRGVAADGKGYYILPNVPLGAYQIAVSAVGYERREFSVVLTSDTLLTQDFWLSPFPVELGEIVIRSESIPTVQPPGTSIRRLEQREVKAVPMAIQADLIRTLLTLPGVLSTSDVSSRFYVRGGGGDQNLILIDGMRLYSPFHGMGVYSVLDPDLIRSTDVYTGAFPAGLGGRLSSVVWLTTKETRTDRVSARAGINLLSSKLELQGPVAPGFQLMMSGRRSLFPGTFKRLTGIQRGLTFYDAMGKLSVKTPWLNNIHLLAFFSGDDMRPERPGEAGYHWGNQLIGLTSAGLVANRMYLSGALYVSRYSNSRTSEPGSIIPPTSSEIAQPGFRFDATLYADEGSDTYNFGVELVLQRVYYSLVNRTGAHRRYRSFMIEPTGWFRYQTTFAGFLALDLGMHADFVGLAHQGLNGLQPRINVSQNLFEDWKLRLAYARVSQSIIATNNEDDLLAIADNWIRVPDKSRPEFAHHTIAGVDGPLTASLSANVQIYQKRYHDLVLYNREKMTARDPDFIHGTGRSWGVETLLRFSDSPVDVYLAYTFSRTTVTSNNFTYAPRYDVRHNVNVMTVFQVLPSLAFSIRWDFKSGYPFTQIMGFYSRLGLGNPAFDPFENDTGDPYAILGPKNAARMPVYHRLDLGLSHRFKMFSLTGEIEASVINVYNRKNVFYFERETGRRINMLPFVPSITLNLSP